MALRPGLIELKKLNVNAYFTKEQIAELKEPEKQDLKQMFLEIEPIPAENIPQPEKLQSALRSRIEGKFELLSKRMEKVLEKQFEILVLKNGKKLRGLFLLIIKKIIM